MFDTLTRMGASQPSGYSIDRSLRFNRGDTPGLSMTGSTPTSDKIGTWSVWVKRTSTGTEQHLFGSRDSGSSMTRIRFESDDQLSFVALASDGSVVWDRDTTRVFRDPSTWYHLLFALDTTDGTAGNRVKVYVNGVQETSFSASTDPSQNATLQRWGLNNEVNVIGKEGTSSYNECMDGYLAEIYYIDGQALTPSSFGETNADTGQWVPIKYTGTYGNNGFYLKFADNSNTTAATLGKDSSGNGHNFTPSNFVTGDAVKDSPTNNFATLNNSVLSPQITFSEGNLHAEIGNAHKTVYSTIAVGSGKWYWEGIAKGSGSKYTIGVSDVRNQGNKQVSGTNYLVGNTSNTFANGDGIGLYVDDLYKNGSLQASNILSDTISDGEICGVALDLDNNKVWFSHKGVWVNGSGSSSTTLDTNNHDTTVTTSFNETYCAAFSGEDSDWQANFGQDSSFSGTVTAQGNADSAGKGDFYYAVPSGFKALCTANLPEPTILKGSDHFNTVLYDGSDSTPLTVSGVGFEPDMTWIKARSTAWHGGIFTKLHSTGVGSGYKYNRTANDDAEEDEWGAITFNSDGWSGVSSDYNGSFAHDFGDGGHQFVSWNWLESASAGFDLVHYTGNATSNREISHNLGVAPEFYIIKSKSQAHDWNCWHNSLASGQYAALNLTNAFASDSGGFMHGAPTSSVIKLGTWGGVNENTTTFNAYCFASVEGYSKIGSYTGNGNADGPMVYTGFKPSFVLIKSSSHAEAWNIFDNKRDPDNKVHHLLVPNTATEENNSTAARELDFLANGFKIRGTDGTINTDNYTYLYMAFAETPFKYANAR